MACSGYSKARDDQLLGLIGMKLKSEGRRRPGVGDSVSARSSVLTDIQDRRDLIVSNGSIGVSLGVYRFLYNYIPPWSEIV